MYFVLLDSTGNLLASYRDEDEARSALAQLVDDDPSAADEVALMTYDDAGEVAADAFFVPTVAPIVGVSPSDWVSPSPEPYESDLEGATRTEGGRAVPA